LYTAGGSDSDISIPGLTDDQASRLRELVIEKNRAE
jgi:membrane protein YdbS with pleckstrin-like domain